MPGEPLTADKKLNARQERFCLLVASGMSLNAAASAFIASAEFTRAYGSAPSDADFVKLLYQNVLQRTPDANGSQYWVDNLQHGQSRADLLVYFSEGKENHDAVAKLIGAGFAYTPYGA